MANEQKSTNYWFKRRRYGWGWIPATWQGWLMLAAFVVILLAASLQLPAKPDQPSTGQMVRFIVTVALAIFALVAISYAKGPQPRWRWGKKPTDNPDEDF